MAINPTRDQPLVPSSGSERSQPVQNGGEGRALRPRGGTDAAGTSPAPASSTGASPGISSVASSGSVAGPGAVTGDQRATRAEPIEDDFQKIVDQATDRARSDRPNAPRGSFLDILV